MERLSLFEIAKFTGGTLPSSDAVVDSVSIDTRTLQKGCLYIALKGDRFDGHDFIQKAVEEGATGVLSEKALPVPGLILVRDTHQALLDLAKQYRKKFPLFLVGITGSVGKTSTKEMVYSVLSAKGKTLKTKGNLNNQIGMPLSVLQLDASCQNAVIEMGMSDFHEISSMSKVALPDVSIITNIGVSHLETLKTRENILKAKLEITDGMAPNAPLILNYDNDLLRTLDKKLSRPLFYFAIDEKAPLTAHSIRISGDGTEFTINDQGQEYPAFVPAIGRHNVYNALAAFLCGKLAGMEVPSIIEALKNYKGAEMRQNVSVKNGVTVIEDCYNASPASMNAAIDVLLHTKCAGRRVCVFGDMLELGDVSEKAHFGVGQKVASSGIDFLFCFGPRAQNIAKGARDAGMKNVWCGNDKKALADALLTTLQKGDAVIFKASRGMALEDVIHLTEEGWEK